MNLRELAAKAYADTREPWGGMTIDSFAQEPVYPDKGFAVMSKPNTLAIPIETSESMFALILILFFAEHSSESGFVGIFHDANRNEILFDNVAIVKREACANAIARQSGAESAYDFTTGNGVFFNERC